MLQSDGKDYSQETLALTAKVLALNPEYQTAWGVRRRVLLEGVFPPLYVSSPLRASLIKLTCIHTCSSPEEKIQSLQADLLLTNEALKSNPKNYSVWEHRKWCLETMGEGADWGREMKMCEAYLERDGRNCESLGEASFCSPSRFLQLFSRAHADLVCSYSPLLGLPTIPYRLDPRSPSLAEPSSTHHHLRARLHYPQDLRFLQQLQCMAL